jgi:hypothetical protein
MQIVISFFLLGEVIDSYLTDQPFTIHYKAAAGLVGAGAVLFIARLLKGVFVRQPIKAESHL